MPGASVSDGGDETGSPRVGKIAYWVQLLLLGITTVGVMQIDRKDKSLLSPSLSPSSSSYWQSLWIQLGNQKSGLLSPSITAEYKGRVWHWKTVTELA